MKCDIKNHKIFGMDYLLNLHLEKDFLMMDLTRSLSQLESEIIKDANLKGFNKETLIIKKLFNIAEREDYNMPKERWDIIRFNIYTFIIVHTPNNSFIPDFSKVAHTTYDPLFFVLTILCTMNVEKQQSAFIKECFLKVKDIILNKEETSPYKFYALTTATYANLLPTLATMKFKDKIIDEIIDFFTNLKSKIDECENNEKDKLAPPNLKNFSRHSVQISYHTHQFFLELLKNLVKPDRKRFNESSVIMIHTLWFNMKASSTLLPQYINFINRILLNDKQISNISINPYDKDRIAKLLAQNSRYLHNDIFKLMPPNQIFEFFNRASSDRNKNKHTIRFICQFLFADNQRDLFTKMRPAREDANTNNSLREDSKFIINQIQHYHKGNARFSLLYFLEQLSSSFGCLTGTIKQIKAVKIGPCASHYRYFSEQVRDKSDLTELDDLLYSKYECVTYTDKEEALKAYEKCFKYIDSFQEKSIIPFSFYQKLMEPTTDQTQIHSHDINNSNGMKVDGNNSSLFFNVRRVFSSFFYLIVEVAYRYMLLTQFLFSDACFTAHANRCFTKCNRFDLSNIRVVIKKMAEILNKPELPDTIIQSYAVIISNILFQAVKERKVTNQLVTYLHMFNVIDPRTQRESRLYQMVINNMIQLAYSSSSLIDMLDVEEANNFNQYLLLILHLGRKLRNGLPTFMMNLREYQKSFITILLNRFRCTNQREFFSTMIQYIRFLNENNDDTLKTMTLELNNSEEAKKKSPMMQPKIQASLPPHALQDSHKELKYLSTYLILDRSVIDHTRPSIKHVLLFYLTTAFQSSDPNLINRAFNNTRPSLLNTTKPEVIRDNQQLLFDNDSDNCRPFYTSLFKSLLKANKDDSLRIISTVPQLLLLFNNWKSTYSVRQVGFVVPRYQVDLFNILSNILIHFTGKESEAINILMFLSALIKDDSFNDNLDKMPIQIIDQIIQNLIGLFSYKIIRQKVVNLFKILHKKFLPVVTNGNFNYLLSLFFNVSLSYSEANSLYAKMIEMFFDMLNSPLSPVFNPKKIIDLYFTQNRTILNYNELLLFLTVVQKKWPGSIQNEHIHLFLFSLTIKNPSMVQHTDLYTKPFNQFFKSYISYLKREQIFPFINIIIQAVESSKFLFSFKRILFKRLFKAKFPSPFKNYNHISATLPDKESFYLKLYLALLFGVQSKEPVPDDIFRRSIEEMKKICKGEVQNLSSTYLFLLISFIRIVFVTQPENSRYFGEDVLKIFLNIINTASLKLSSIDTFRKQIDNCLKLLRERAPSLYEKIAKEVMDTNLSMNPNQNPNYQLILKKVVRHSSLFSEYITKEHIFAVFQQIIEFINYSFEQKVKLLNQTIKYIMLLTLPDYSSQQGIQIKNFLMSEYKDMSHFAYLFHVFVVMLYDPSYVSYYTFFDCVQLFLNKFKKETIEVIISHHFIDDIENSYDLLYNLTIEDETDEFFDLILEKFEKLMNDDASQYQQKQGSNAMLSTQTHIAGQHPAFFNVLNRLMKLERYASRPKIGHRLYLFFRAVMFDKRQADNKTTAMNILIDAALDTLKYSQSLDHIIFITNYISSTSVNTPLYRKFKEIVFKNRDRKFYVDNFIHFLSKYTEIKPYEVIEIILVQLLKGLKSLKKEEDDEVDLDELFLTEMRNMINNPDLLSCAMGCFVVYFQYNKPDLHNLPLALSAFGPSLMQPNSYCIIHVFKIANILLGDRYYYNTFNNANNDNNNDSSNDNDNNEDKNDSKEEEDTNDSNIPNQNNIFETNFDENKIYLPYISDLIQQVLHFQKFLDQPFIPYVSTLFRNANKLFNKNNIPESLADCFKQFVVLKMVRCKELEKVINVVQMMPVLLECIPFSLAYSTCHNIDLCAQNMRNNSFKLEDNFNVFFFAIRYFQKQKMTEDEESYIFKFCFNFLREIFKGEYQFIKPNIEIFLRPLMSKAKYMPSDLLDIVSHRFSTDEKAPIQIKYIFATFSVLATEEVDAQILLRNAEFIVKIFEGYIQKMSQYFRIYIQSIFNRPELVNSLFTDNFFRVLQNHSILEIRIQLLGAYISTTEHPDKLKYLTLFWKKELQPIHYQRLSGYIENLPFNQQMDYLELVLEKTKQYRIVLYPVFVTNFINSKKVTNQVKIEFLRRLPTFIDELDFLFISKLYDAVHDLDLDTFKYELLLLFYSMVKCNDSSRLLYFSKLKELCGRTEEERFITLIEVIHPCLWTNSNLIYISFIVIDDSSKLDLPLVMLSHMFDSFSSDFMTNVFMRIMNKRTSLYIQKLLTDCLYEQLKQKEVPPDNTRYILSPQQKQKQNYNNNNKNIYVFDNYTQVVTSIIRALHASSFIIQPTLLYKSLKLVNDFSLFSCLDNDKYYSIDMNNIDDNSNIIPDKLLLPSKVNDVIFGSVMKNVSNESLSASAQFFLGNYEEAERMYRRTSFPENKIVQRLQQITNDICIKMKYSQKNSNKYHRPLPLPISSSNSSSNNEIAQSILPKFSIFDRPDHEDLYLLPYLESAFLSDNPSKMEKLLLAEKCNVLYYKHHPHLSYYERERLSAIESIIMLMRTKIKSTGNQSSIPIPVPAPIPAVTPSIQPNPNPIQVQHQVPVPITQPVLSAMNPQQPPQIPQMMPQIDQQQQQQMQMGRLKVPITSPQQPTTPPQQAQYRSPQMPRQVAIMQLPQNQQQQQQQQQQLQQRPMMQNTDFYNYKITPNMYYLIESCLPPPMSKFVIDFSLELSNSDSHNNNNNNSFNNRIIQPSPVIIFSSEFRSFFQDMSSIIEPVDYHGFFAVNSTSLFNKFNYYLTNLPKKQPQQNPKSQLMQQEQQQQQQQQQTLSSFDPFLWPSFCFNIFASSEKSSDVLFKVALESYLKLLTEEKVTHPVNPSAPKPNPNQPSQNTSLLNTPILSMPPFLCLSASARVMNLFSYSISNQIESQAIFNAAFQCCNMIVPDQTTHHLKLWMPQLVSLRADFSSVFSERTENLVNSYAHTATCFAHKIQIRQKPELKKAEKQIDILSRLCDLVFNISNNAFEAARKRKKMTNNNCEDLLVSMNDLDINDLNEEEKKIHKVFFDNLKSLNQHLPFDYDRRTSFLMKAPIKIIHFNPNFAKLSENALTFTAMTIGPPRQRFVVERVDNTDRAVTFSNVFEGMKNIFKYGYSSRLRRIRLSSNPAMELGSNFVMRLFPLEITPLQLSNKIEENKNNEHFDVGFFDVDENDKNKNLEENDDSPEEGWLLNKMMAMYTQKDFFKMRRAIIASFAAYSVIRNMFSLDQPNEKDLLLAINTAEFPFIIRDFAIPDNFGQTASLITNELRILFGESGPGELAMSIAAASDALERHIDAVRSLVEVPLVGIFDNREKDFDIILSKRDWIDYSVLSLAPPLITNKMKQNINENDNLSNDTENGDDDDRFADESVRWIINIQKFVSNSMEKFDRILYDNDFIETNKLNMNINTSMNFDVNSSNSSTNIMNPLGDMNNIMDFNDNNNSRNNNNNNDDNIDAFIFQPHDDDDQGFGNYDIDPRDDQIDDLDNLF